MLGLKQTLPPKIARNNKRFRLMSMATGWWLTGKKCLTNIKGGRRWRCTANPKHPISHRRVWGPFLIGLGCLLR